MKKRLLPVLLALVMVLGMLPLTVFADSEPEGEEEVQVQEEAAKVAKIGDTEYETISAALSAAENGATIEVIANTSEDVTIAEGKVITLNIGEGVTLKNSTGDTITNNGTLTITGTGTVDNETHAKATLINNGTATLNGCTFSRSKEAGSSSSNNGGNSYYTIVNSGTMIINEGTTVIPKVEGETITGSFSSLVRNNASSNESRASLTINGGTFKGGINTVKNDSYADLTINGGTFTNTAQYVIMNWDSCEINDGTFDCSGASTTAVVFNAKNTTNPGSSGDLAINGGTFVASESATAAVSTNTYGGSWTNTAQPITVAPEATFNKPIAAKNLSNVAAQVSNDGTYTYYATVEEAREAAEENGGEVNIPASGDGSWEEAKYIVTIADTTGGSVSVDNANNEEGTTVSITVTANTGFAVASISVKDSDGNEVPVTASKFLMPASDVTVTVKFAANGIKYAYENTGVLGGTIHFTELTANQNYIVQIYKANASNPARAILFFDTTGDKTSADVSVLGNEAGYVIELVGMYSGTLTNLNQLVVVPCTAAAD